MTDIQPWTAQMMERSLLQPLMEMPAWPRRMLRVVNQQLSGVYQNLHLIFGTGAGYQPQQPSEEMTAVGLRLFEILSHRCAAGNQHVDGLAEAKAILAECHDLTTLTYVTNADGYNVLQMALIKGDLALLQVLISEGCDLNCGTCSLPLHLACRLGNVDTVRFLLDRGARPNLATGMCYPKAHTPVRHVPSRFHFLETDIYACDGDPQLPVMYAIQADNVEIVRILMELYQPKIMWPYQRQPLHHACKHGAYHSMRYLVSLHPHEIHDTDEDGMLPLLHAIKWGKKFAKFLVEAEANIHVRSSKGRTALHELFLHIEDPLQLYETTRFLLGSGLEQDISATDCNKNTPLHILIAQVNCLVKSFPGQSRGQSQNQSQSQSQTQAQRQNQSHTECQTVDFHTVANGQGDSYRATTSQTELQGPRVSMNDAAQSDFDEQVLRTLEELLVHNCDANLISSSGVTALHKLLLTFDFVISNDPTGITLETLPVREKYKIDFEMLYASMLILLRHGACPNIMTGAGRTPLLMLLHSMLNVDPCRLQHYTMGFEQCIGLLCRHGALPSYSLSTHIATIITLCKFGHKCLSQREASVKILMSDLLKSVLAILLQHGLDSNHCSLRSSKREVEGDSGNLLVELVKLAQFIRNPADLDFVYGWVLTSLQWGANPDIEPYPSDSIICTSQSSIYLKPKGTQPVNQYMYQIQDQTSIIDNSHAINLLRLFYNSMDHSALYHCLGAARSMSRFDPSANRVPSTDFLHMVTSFMSQPRSLKQIARVSIYKAIQRQLRLRVHQLPVPHALQEYLTEIES